MSGEFVAVRCPCGAVVLDCYALHGIARVACPKCRRRVWVGGGDDGPQALYVDKRPERATHSTQ
jgi:Zn-finger nucleic acid-binding protein